MEAKKKRKFDFKWLCRLKTKLYIGPPNFFLNFKSFYIEKSWGALVPIFVNLPPFGPWTRTFGGPVLTGSNAVPRGSLDDGPGDAGAVGAM